MMAARILRQWPAMIGKRSGLLRCFSKSEAKNNSDQFTEDEKEELEKEFKNEILTKEGIDK